MIKLDLEKYCDDCELFEPYVNKYPRDLYFENSPFETGKHTICDTTIRCTHKNRCAFFVEYLSDKLKRS